MRCRGRQGGRFSPRAEIYIPFVSVSDESRRHQLSPKSSLNHFHQNFRHILEPVRFSLGTHNMMAEFHEPIMISSDDESDYSDSKSARFDFPPTDETLPFSDFGTGHAAGIGLCSRFLRRVVEI